MFSRPLVTFAFDADEAGALALARMLVPEVSVIYVVLRVPLEARFVLGNVDLHRVEARLAQGEQALDALRVALSLEGIDVQGEVVADVLTHGLADAVRRHAPDVVVFGRFKGVTSDVIADWALDCARTFDVATVLGHARDRAPTRLVCPFDGRAASIAGIAPFLRDHCDERHVVRLFAVGPLDERLHVDLDTAREITGMRAHVEMTTWSSWRAGSRDAEAALLADDPDLIVVPSAFASGFAADVVRSVILWAIPTDTRPLLFVPSSSTAFGHEGALDALDVLDVFDARPLQVRVEHLAAFGGPRPLANQAIDIVRGGRRVATEKSVAGMLAIPTIEHGTFGLGRSAPGRDALETLETAATIFARPVGRVALIDAHLDPTALTALVAALDDPDRAFIAVRLSPNEPALSIRARLRAAGIAHPCLLDVRDILDEGDTADVPDEVFAVRLCRAAGRLRVRAVALDVVVAYAPAHARAQGFALLGPQTIAYAKARIDEAYVSPRAWSEEAELDVRTGSKSVPGNRLAIDLDNAAARARMIALIDGAKGRCHAQWYIVEDDEVSREFEAAFVRASARGVVVRILVDSLYSLHDSFGARNPLLDRLSAIEGVEVRAARPILQMPGLEDLKRRDHRKLATADGVHGIVSGRNLARTYYLSFAEAHVTPASVFTDVPWLDASVSLEGPAVAALDASFLEAWIEAGGAAFPILPAPSAGETTVRVVVHRGLEDAYTLEAYLALIEQAKTRLVVVNSFPFQREVLHALLSAIARGVSVSVLVGHVRPVYGEDIAFPGGMYRAIVDALVRARLDALVQVGADVRELVVPTMPGWDEAFGVVRPYVHAKLLVADARCVAIGSANLDITAGYWESEALVVFTDDALGAAFHGELAALLASAQPIDARDPKWQKGAERRAWLGRIWPSVLG